MNEASIERSLWQQLAARGAVAGDYTPTLRTPWPIRLLMGAAGWLGAIFFQLFLVGSVFAATRGNGPAMAVTGVLMIGMAVVLYRITAKEAGRIALGQFALALSLGGQGMLFGGAGEAFGFDRMTRSAPFWLAVAAVETVLFAIVADRLHRFLVALGSWVAVAIALCIVVGDIVISRWSGIPVSVGVLAALALAVVAGAVLAEHRLAASGRHDAWAPAIDATLVFSLAGMLVVTGATHPAYLLFGDAKPWSVPAGWLPGVLAGIVWVAFAWRECQRLDVEMPLCAAAIGVASALGALMLLAPAVTAGVLVLALALRRGSMVWLGLAIATLLLGFVWYYSTLQWTLLAKSATLVAAGVLLLAARAALGRGARKEVVA